MERENKVKEHKNTSCKYNVGISLLQHNLGIVPKLRQTTATNCAIRNGEWKQDNGPDQQTTRGTRKADSENAGREDPGSLKT